MISRANTEQEMRDAFMSQVKCIARYWSKVECSEKERCEGVAFSIMNIFDGTFGGFPAAIDLVLRPHPEDKQYNIDNGDDYVVDGMCINNNVYLHELLK